jgi:hypothetical protein
VIQETRQLESNSAYARWEKEERAFPTTVRFCSNAQLLCLVDMSRRLHHHFYKSVNWIGIFYFDIVEQSPIVQYVEPVATNK